eukprot:CAMPEP_0176502134 /NCGR_PEP_ID=MMETSP0200_2-20121128/14578_1 /TAXON_ID=947934 /ORGANISM="Chaetoceros sp., Strain GSL56" /LENGTH=429 /DNA_ID=CAMNT_0017901159 /DNA_START=109 /DNA_END=1398 /DNA_ORIENTATION=-
MMMLLAFGFTVSHDHYHPHSASSGHTTTSTYRRPMLADNDKIRYRTYHGGGSTSWKSTHLLPLMMSSSSSSSSTSSHTSTSDSDDSRDKEGPVIGYNNSCLLAPSEINPIITLKKGTPKEKIVNAFGLYSIIVTLMLNPIWAFAMFLVDSIYQIFPDVDPNRAIYDQTGKLWSKAWLALTNSYPSTSGRPIDDDFFFSFGDDDSKQTACLFVANHASWLDIPVLCTVLDPVFKFIAKGELLNVPCIGQQLTGGKHILIDRQDRRSQLRTFKEGVQWLQKGVPLMAFPEGKRSQDGRLDEFKGGIFSMALKANVPIVPISISNTHAIMPSNALFPFQSGSGKLHVHIHEPIHVEGRTEEELVELVREALLSRMPLEQHPFQQSIEGEGEVESKNLNSDRDDDDNNSGSNATVVKKDVSIQGNSIELQSTI